MNAEIRRQFPAAVESAYLNSAAVAPLPTVAVDAMKAQLSDAALAGSAGLPAWFEMKDRVRALVAEMLGVKATDIALTQNTSEGLSAAAAGISWQPGDNIVTFANEFPANRYPWRRLRDIAGVELRECPERCGRYDIDELVGAIDGRTRLVTVSAIQYSTGYRADLERIGEAAKKEDALFAVDMVQAFGVTPLDLPGMNVDIAAGASYKWLCAPPGCGILYMNDRARERVECLTAGWLGVERPWEFEDSEQPFRMDTRAWETGISAFPLYFGLDKSLGLLMDAGIHRVAAYLAELTDFLCEIVHSKRYSVVSSRHPSERSQIVSIEPLNGLTAAEVTEHLAREKVVVSARGKRIRIAPHFFNNFADIERLADCLP